MGRSAGSSAVDTLEVWKGGGKGSREVDCHVFGRSDSISLKGGKSGSRRNNLEQTKHNHMPVTKQLQTTQTGHTFTRVQILDSLILSLGRLPKREGLVRLMSRKLGKPISPRSIDTDIAKIRQMLAAKRSGVKLINDANGYRYSEYGYSLFACRVTESDRELLQAAHLLLRVYLGENAAESFRRLGERVMEQVACPEVEGFHGFEGVSHDPEMRLAGGKWLVDVMNAIQDKSSLRVVFKGEESGRAEHLSPYRMTIEKGDCVLTAHRMDLVSNTAGTIERFPLSKMVDVQASNRRYQEERDVERRMRDKVHCLPSLTKEERYGFPGNDGHGLRA